MHSLDFRITMSAIFYTRWNNNNNNNNKNNNNFRDKYLTKISNNEKNANIDLLIFLVNHFFREFIKK